MTNVINLAFVQIPSDYIQSLTDSVNVINNCILITFTGECIYSPTHGECDKYP